MTAPQPTDLAASLPRRQRLLVSGQLWMLGMLGLLYLCSHYAGTARPATARGWVFVLGGALSCAASLSLLPGLLGLGAAALLSSRRALGSFLALEWTLALFLLYVDTRIWGI